MDESKKPPVSSGKTDTKPKAKRNKSVWKYDYIIQRLRSVKIPINRTALRNVAVERLIESVKKEGEVDYKELAVIVSAEKIKEKVSSL